MLEKLFTSKTRVKILEYLLFKSQETYIRKIARELKISPSAVKREIDSLASLAIIRVNQNRIILNEKCNFLKDLKNIFIKSDFIIYPLSKVLIDKKIKYAFIFGSFARGDYKDYSDLDLMVIGDIKSFNLYKRIKPVEGVIKKDINPVIWTLENLKKEKVSSFIKDIFKKGIIMIKGDENELREIIE